MHFHSWRAKGEKRELELREFQGFGGIFSHLWFPSDQEEERRLGCDAPKHGDPVDHRQPAEIYVSHIMRPIHE